VNPGDLGYSDEQLPETSTAERISDMLTILLIILLVLFLTGGGYGFSRRGRL